MGDKGRQDPREGGHTIQQRETRGTVGDKERQDPREGGDTTQQQRETRKGTMGDKGDKTLKADILSNKGQQERVKWETELSGRRAHHPSKANKKG